LWLNIALQVYQHCIASVLFQASDFVDFDFTLRFFWAELREIRRRSQAVQRNMPRPSDANAAVLRPANVDPPLTGLQQVKNNNKQINSNNKKQKKRKQNKNTDRHSVFI